MRSYEVKKCQDKKPVAKFKASQISAAIWENEITSNIARCDFDCPDGVFFDCLLYLSTLWLETNLTLWMSAGRTGDSRLDVGDYALPSEYWLEGTTP
jgi:hypothetical protein